VEISRETLETRWRYIGEIGDEYTVWWLMVRWGLGTGDWGFRIRDTEIAGDSSRLVEARERLEIGGCCQATEVGWRTLV